MAGSILNVLYALNLTETSYVLYLLLRFLGSSTNLQCDTGRYIRGNLVPSLTEHPSIDLVT